jgi:hypothetical protein
MVLLFTLVVFGLVGFALYWSSRDKKDEHAVLGTGNFFDAYYSKDRSDPNPAKTPPCANCVSWGCIGAGECRCQCHADGRKKK